LNLERKEEEQESGKFLKGREESLSVQIRKQWKVCKTRANQVHKDWPCREGLSNIPKLPACTTQCGTDEQMRQRVKRVSSALESID
jgi:hypothetical protein